MNTFEKDQLARELHDRAHDVDGHPIGLASVKRSARRIQRRRRIASGAVAAAVLAIAVPTALSVTNGPNRSADPVAPTPSPSVTKEPTPRPDGTFALTTTGLERSGEPAITYIYDAQIIEADGSSTPVDEQYTDVTPYAGGWLASGNGEVVFLDTAGEVTDSSPGAGTIAVTTDGENVAYYEPGLLTAVSADGSDPMTWEFSPDAAVVPVGMLDDRTVVYNEDSVDPVVMVAIDDGETSPVPGMIRADGVSDASGLVAGLTRSRPDGGSCSAVVDPLAGEQWMTCNFQLGQFSPDGRYVLASDAYVDGLGATDVAILDAHTREVVVRYQRQGRDNLFVHEAVWEDDTHVLASVYQDGAWTMVRMDLEGNLSAASPAVEGDETSWPFEFSARP